MSYEPVRPYSDGAGEFVVRRKEHVRLGAGQGLGDTLVVFVTEEDADVVSAVGVVPVDELLVGDVCQTAVADADDTVLGSELSVEGVRHAVRASLVDTYGVVRREGEVVGETDLEEARSGELVGRRLAHAEVGVRQSVRTGEYRTAHAAVQTCTVVIACDAQVIDHDVAFGVTHVHRIDGSHTGSGSEDVARRCGTAFAGVAVLVFGGDCELRDVSCIPENTYIVYMNEACKMFDTIVQSNVPANYGNKYEVLRVLEEAVRYGGNPEVQVRHIRNIERMLEKNAR